jgi:type II secretory pathway component GspD/PulD (secretin)
MAASISLAAPLWAQTDGRTVQIKPQYLPPPDLARILGVHDVDGRGVISWQEGGVTHSVDVRRNDAANLMIVTGAPGDVALVESMAKAADVAPRQIAIEARIVEIDTNKALDAGIDWSMIRTDASLSQQDFSSIDRQSSDAFRSVQKRSQDAFRISANASLFDALRLLDEAGAATFRDAPRIVTLNNRRATILDGQRVTYITRYSSYTNLFETDTLDAGLTLTVTPSLGESGYLTLDLNAELTSLSSNISGSPVKDGQIVENTVVVKDGETILLGGFLRTVEQRRRRFFPVLGHVLPMVFSRETATRSRRESFVAVTPRVVDLAAKLDAATQEKLEGR